MSGASDSCIGRISRREVHIDGAGLGITWGGIDTGGEEILCISRLSAAFAVAVIAVNVNKRVEQVYTSFHNEQAYY